MTGDQCERALLAGAFLARDLKQMGYGILASGEMGIGNTTPASALASSHGSLPGWSPDGGRSRIVGFLRKQKAVEAACERFFLAVSQV
ncbi:MAG: nicotinate-nucleotide--dimethylbenzimidazole phosphoribosyltransferase [Enterocloster sp.]